MQSGISRRKWPRHANLNGSTTDKLNAFWPFYGTVKIREKELFCHVFLRIYDFPIFLHYWDWSLTPRVHDDMKSFILLTILTLNIWGREKFIILVIRVTIKGNIYREYPGRFWITAVLCTYETIVPTGLEYFHCNSHSGALMWLQTS